MQNITNYFICIDSDLKLFALFQRTYGSIANAPNVSVVKCRLICCLLKHEENLSLKTDVDR